MDLSKYLKNKDIKIKEDDFDIEGLKADMLKGYIPEKEVETKVKSALTEKETELTKKYTDLESSYNQTIKKLDDTNGLLSKTRLEKAMVLKGFKEEKFEEVSKLRESLFADEKDDMKAIEGIAERFKGTYFADVEKPPVVPNEAGIKPNGTVANGGTPIKVDRNTPLTNMFIAKQS